MNKTIEMVFEDTLTRVKNHPNGSNTIYNFATMEARANLAANLKYLRKRDGLSQEDLSRLSDVSQSVVSNLERGTAYARLDILEKLAPAFGESVWVLHLPHEILEATNGLPLIRFLTQLATLTETDRELFLNLFQKLAKS